MYAAFMAKKLPYGYTIHCSYVILRNHKDNKTIMRKGQRMWQKVRKWEWEAHNNKMIDLLSMYPVIYVV